MSILLLSPTLLRPWVHRYGDLVVPNIKVKLQNNNSTLNSPVLHHKCFKTIVIVEKMLRQPELSTPACWPSACSRPASNRLQQTGSASLQEVRPGVDQPDHLLELRSQQTAGSQTIITAVLSRNKTLFGINEICCIMKKTILYIPFTLDVSKQWSR